ncbi:hypothetical protein [Chitinophaga sp. MM2321]|uniref:hypothetical protein n=1 Tax=Chitinophaga sp. MM2321 TaxID=3137178 RepID=UPI0032D5A214
MRKRWLIILCCMGLALPGLRAQNFSLKPVKLLPAVKTTTHITAPVPAPPRPDYPVYLLAPNTYYNQCFGFFCKQEWGLQKHTGVPVKFRLGNYSYAQRQEGKH